MTIRLATTDELPFVKSSWLQSYASSDFALLSTPKDADHTVPCPSCGHRALRAHRVRGITQYKAGEEYWDGQKRLIDALIARSNVSVYLVEDEGIVDGWICRSWSRPVVNYVYVRASARGQGVARALLDDLAGKPGVIYSHKSRNVDSKRLPRGWAFDPYEMIWAVAGEEGR